MKLHTSTCFAFAVILSSCSASKKTADAENNNGFIFDLSSFTFNAPIKIDGDISEWNSNIAYKDNHSTLTTFISADTSNLYVALIISQQWLQMKILKMGMQLYFDTSGNQDTRHFISYPVILQSADNENEKNINSMLEKEKLIASSNILQTSGLMITADAMHEHNNAAGVKAALGKDVAGNLIYEAAIPLNEIYIDGSNKIQKKSLLSIGFIINSFPKQEASHASATSSAERQPQHGQFNGGNKNQDNNYLASDMTTETKLWVKARW